jgi:hypothetical protein
MGRFYTAGPDFYGQAEFFRLLAGVSPFDRVEFV